MKWKRIIVWVLSALLAETANAALTTNNWFLFSGKWENGGNWSAGIPSSDDAVNTITNDLSAITVTIDTATVTQHVINGCMTISNLVVGRATAIPLTLLLNNANNTPGNIGLTILNSFTLNATGILSITNSDLRVTSPSGGLFDDGTAVLNTGNITVTNLSIGRTGVGTLTVSNGTLVARTANVAELGGARGTLTIAGGTATFLSLTAGTSGLTGTVWLTGGQLTVSNQSTAIGDPGFGNVTVSNGTWAASIVSVRQGALTITGGSHQFWELAIASGASSLTATVWLVGGNLAITNTTTAFSGATNDTLVGLNGFGQLTISNGTFLTRNLYVGTNTGSRGTFTVAGGTNTVTSGLHLDGTAGATGTVWMTGGQLTVTNGPTQVGFSGVAQMTVSNGTFLAREMYVGTNTGSQGTFTVAGGTNTLSSFLHVGERTAATGAVWVTDGLLVITNSPTIVGVSGVAQLTLSNGTFLTGVTCVGSNSGSRGALTIAGGTNFVNGGLQVGLGGAATGSVWITGGALLATNSGATIGASGVGQITISNGLYRTQNVVAGLQGVASGTLRFAGGTTELASLFLGSNGATSTGTVWLTGGELLNLNGAFVGLNGVGLMTVSNGTWQVGSVVVAGNAGSKGTLNIDGGTNSLSATLIIGSLSCASTGNVTVTGGTLLVTNASGFGTIDVRSGTFTISGGLVQVDTIVLTNSCAHFARAGGTLIYGTAVLDPNRDDDGDGIPNGYEQAHALDPLNAADANLDNDGDGMSNLQEFLAGTDATNSASYFHITSVARTSNDIRVTWMMGPGKTNALQVTAGTGGGSYQTNSFANLFVVTNTIGTTTNYLDVGGATNSPARYYRIRLVP